LWRKLVLVSLNEDLSQIECINVATTKYIFMLLLSVVIAFAIKVVGVLLTALLIIPAAWRDCYQNLRCK
jgi:zinc transport system permease protein